MRKSIGYHKFYGQSGRACSVCHKQEAHAIHHNVKYPNVDPRSE